MGEVKGVGLRVNPFCVCGIALNIFTMFDLITPSTNTPLSVEDIKAHLNITTTDFDGVIVGVFLAAIDLVEKTINGPLLTAEYAFYTDSFCFPIHIPKGNVKTVTAFEYRSADGIWHDVPAMVWDYSTVAGKGVVFLKPNVTFGYGTLYSYNPIRITFKAGYGDDPASVPEPLKHAIKIVAGHLFENRDSAMSGVPMPAQMILNHYRCVTSEMF